MTSLQGYNGEDSFERFRDHIEKRLEEGYEAQGTPAKFASIHCLTDYWTETHAIEDIVFNARDLEIHISGIREQYLRIFSILVWISTTSHSYVRYLKYFVRKDRNDVSLPFVERPAFLPSSATDSEAFWTSFFDNQWMFCPVPLGPKRIHNRDLHAKQILPFTIGEDLGSSKIGRPASIRLANVHASETLGRTHPTDGILVLKSYDTQYRNSYYNEIRAYNAFDNGRPCENILKCLGSYHVQPLAPGSGLQFTIILEYANRGSLLGIYEENNPPFTFAETKAFWSSLQEVARGLMVAQNTLPTRPGASCVHQDIKPSNILVFGRENLSASKEDLTFKISDFGNSHTRRSAPYDAGTLGYDSGSTRTYCPPELHWSDELDLIVGPLVDTWSLGCVLIEAAVWICFGRRGRVEFQQRRRDENNKSAPAQRDRGSSDSFHNGIKRLKTVEDVLELVERHGRKSDELTPKVVRLVLDHLLVKDDSRYDARLLCSELDNMIRTTFEWTGDHLSRQTSRASSAAHSQRTEDSRRSHHEEFDDPQRTSTSPQYSPFNPTTMNEDHQSPSTARMSTISTVPDRGLSIRSQHNSGESWNNEAYGAPHVHSRTTEASSITLPDSNGRDDTRPMYSAAPHVGNLHSNFSTREHTETTGQRRSQHYSVQSQPSDQSRLALRADTFATTSSNSTVTPLQPSDHRMATFPHVSLEDVAKRRDEGKTPKLRRSLPGEEQAMAFLKKRDHILVIDNSKYMRNFKNDVLRVFTNVAHILEAADPNGLDVVCTSDPGNMQHSKTTERLIQFVRSNFDKGAHAPCFIEEALKILVDKVINKFPSGPGERRSLLSMIKSEKARPISIYILTSGLWDSSPATKDSTCGAERPINQLINELKKRNLHKSQVAIQFIRFGDNETGKERLRYLDDSLGKPDHDIVDHKPSTGSLWPMLIGSLDEGNDREEDT